MTFWMIVLMFFAVRRLAFGGYRRREWREMRAERWREMREQRWRGSPFWQVYYRRGTLGDYAFPAASSPVVLNTETRFDVLKRRFVKGEISDEQYERELDELLKTPEGRSLVDI